MYQCIFVLTFLRRFCRLKRSATPPHRSSLALPYTAPSLAVPLFVSIAVPVLTFSLNLFHRTPMPPPSIQQSFLLRSNAPSTRSHHCIRDDLSLSAFNHQTLASMFGPYWYASTSASPALHHWNSLWPISHCQSVTFVQNLQRRPLSQTSYGTCHVRDCSPTWLTSPHQLRFHACQLGVLPENAQSHS